MLGTSILSGLAIAGGFIAFILPGIWLAVGLSFASILLIDKGLFGRVALASSLALVKHRWGATVWRIIVPAFVFGMLTFFAQSIISLLISLLFGSSLLHTINEIGRESLFGATTVSGLRALSIMHVMESLTNAIFVPLLVISNVFLYRSLQETKNQA